MCRAFVFLYFPVFAIFNGIYKIFKGFTYGINGPHFQLRSNQLGEVWGLLTFLQLVNSIYGLILVCAKSELKCLIIPWACQSFCINILFFFWTIIFSQDGSGGFEATEAITFAYVEAFSIYTLKVVFNYYCEFVEQITLRHISFCCV